MSFQVMVVAEDPTNNGYILKPLAKALLAACGKPNARVQVLSNPRTQGYEHAKSLLKSELIDRYRFVQLLLFLPDADGKDRAVEFAELEAQAQFAGTNLLCCAAMQEVEAWLLAGHLDKLTVTWSAISTDSSVKETTFEPFLRNHGDQRLPGGGREQLMKETLTNYSGLKARCPELQTLEDRISVSLL